MASSKCFLPLIALFCVWNRALAFPSSTESLVVSTSENSIKESLPEKDSNKDVSEGLKITEMRIFSNVSNRFAHTVVRSKVKNFEDKAKEATFSIVLPESAYISGFIMEIGGKNYTAYVKEKEEAKRTYDEAIASGFGAAHVAVDTRDSNVFTVSVNVEPASKAVFYLTYEELLNRQYGIYELVINVRPGQPVKDLGVTVEISESRPLKDVKAPPIRTGNEISSDKEELDPRANIEKINSTSATVTFNPTIQRQKELAKYLGGKEDDGLSGQFVVQYDVERDPSGGEVILDDGYFVHFFAPTDVEQLPKQVVFVLDTSGSMYDRKLEQLKEAMHSILDELKSSDKFNLVEFNTDVKVWDIDSNNSALYPPGGASWVYEESNASLEEVRFPPAYSVDPATTKKAKSLISEFIPTGGTNINDALKVALHLVENERKTNGDKLQSIIMFLTDGDPTVGITNADNITKKVTEFNEGLRKSAIFCLSFGEGANKEFLQKLALQNSAFSKHIYEAADASLQLQGFYKQISSPLLANVVFKYVPTVTGVTKTKFPLLFNGSEIVVAGRYDTANESMKEIALPVSCFGVIGPLTLKPTVTERPVTGLQRLWAYLTIKQLLEQKEIANNPEELKKKALDLALQHSFVTPVSSLVVVKPNETKAVNTESTHANANQPVYLTLSKASSPLGAVGLSAPIAAFAPTAARGPGLHYSTALHSAFPAPSYVPNYAFDADVQPESADSEIEIAMTTGRADNYVFGVFPWLRNEVNENGTIHFDSGDYKLVSDNPVQTVKCSNAPPAQGAGNCTLVGDCPMAPSFLNNISDLRKFFCPLESYVGVCCPELVAMP